MRARMRSAAWGLLLVTGLGVATAPANAQLQWSSKDEKMNFKIGLLGQMQGEMVDVAGTNDTATNLFMRRLRLIMGFTLGEKLSVFFETDSPNLGKANNAGVKDTGDVFVQDFVATYKFSPQFMLDGGMLLVEPSYNHNQSAAALLATDYGPYTFVESVPMGERVGRDYGLRARGYLLENHLEYRAGIYQGVRGTNAANDLRFTGRVMYSFFTPQVGLDLFWDQPVGENGFVFQADYVNTDGGTFVALPEQTNMLFETGFYFSSIRLQPFLQYATQNFDAASRVDEERLTVGLGYYINGHNNNLKLSYTKIEPDAGESRDQINLQWQIFQF